ncbi:ATP-dependent RNA helicase mtr4 [Hypoxylon texense]
MVDVVLPSQESRPKHELLGIVDQYDDTSVEEHLDFLGDPYLRRYARADGPNLVVSNSEEDNNLQSINHRQSMDPVVAGMVQKLQEAVLVSLKRPTAIDLDTVYDLYQSLPEPRVSHISARLRHRLLAVLGNVERKDSKSMLRYFSVVTDVKNSGFPLTIYEWNTAMSFASRYVGRSTEIEVEAALHLWREMERDAGVKALDVTFNILFDVASKAGKMTLAEMIYQEMMNRGLPFNRYHHVSLIHYFGLKQDSGGVRAAYKEMVQAGEVIDSTVLNCVISGFLNSGEEESAERVYEKMKESVRGSTMPPTLNYTLKRNMTKVLMMFARVGKKHPDLQPSFQQAALIYPDLQTYRLLINHYGPKLGDLAKVVQFLDEMKFYNVPLHGAIFLALFKGFGKHGGPGSDWTAQRLGKVWDAFLDALDAGTEGLYINSWMAMAVLRAFSKYSSRDQLLDIYGQLKSRWNLDQASSQFMVDFLSKLLEQRGFHIRS